MYENPGYFAKANEYYRKNEYENARENYKKEIERNPFNIDAKHNYFCTEDDLGNLEIAIKGLEDLKGQYPFYSLTYNTLAYLYKKKADNLADNLRKNGINDVINEPAVRELYEKSILHDKIHLGKPGNEKDWEEKSYIRIGNCYNELKNYDEAISNYKKGLKLDPFNWNALRFSGILNIKKDKPDIKTALKSIRKAEKIRYPDCESEKMVSFFNTSKERDGFKYYKEWICKGYAPSVLYSPLKGNLIWMMMHDKIILNPIQNIHIPRTAQRRIRKIGDRYKLVFDYVNHDDMIKRLNQRYGDGITNYDFYNRLSLENDKDLTVVTVYLYLDGKFASGDLGIMIKNKIYYSLSGLYEIPNTGTDMLILIGDYLIKNGFELWDMGVDHYKYNQYKYNLNFKKVTTEQYIKLFNKVTQCKGVK